MIVAEQKILGRGKSTFTAVVGYAGGTKLGQENKANTPTTRKVIVRDFASKHTDDFRRHMGLGLKFRSLKPAEIGCPGALRFENFCQGVLPQHDG